ncbi:MAG: hypothetical protein Tsb0015_05920 [Simkaniaceae bacterium]
MSVNSLSQSEVYYAKAKIVEYGAVESIRLQDQTIQTLFCRSLDRRNLDQCQLNLMIRGFDDKKNIQLQKGSIQKFHHHPTGISRGQLAENFTITSYYKEIIVHFPDQRKEKLIAPSNPKIFAVGTNSFAFVCENQQAYFVRASQDVSFLTPIKIEIENSDENPITAMSIEDCEGGASIKLLIGLDQGIVYEVLISENSLETTQKDIGCQGLSSIRYIKDGWAVGGSFGLLYYDAKKESQYFIGNSPVTSLSVAKDLEKNELLIAGQRNAISLYAYNEGPFDQGFKSIRQLSTKNTMNFGIQSVFIQNGLYITSFSQDSIRILFLAADVARQHFLCSSKEGFMDSDYKDMSSYGNRTEVSLKSLKKISFGRNFSYQKL